MMPARARFTVALYLALAATLPAIAETPQPTAQQYYESALDRMRALPEPAFATYTATVRGENDHVDISRDPKDGTLDLSIGLVHGHNNNTEVRSVSLRAADQMTSTALDDATHAVTRSGILNPTWGGAYRMMRDGWGAWGSEATPSPSPGPSAPAAEQSGALTIAVVRAISPGFYRIEDGGVSTCSNGAPAHRIHLIAYRDPLDHPLTDALIDTHSQEFCSLRFGIHQSITIASATGQMVLDFTHDGPYQLISTSTIEVDFHAMGFKVKHLGVDVSYTNFAFPPSIPSATFTPQPGQTRSTRE